MDQALLLITIYCMVAEELIKPNFQKLLTRPGPKPKMSDLTLITLVIFQEFSGIKDEDEYWAYVQKRYGDYFPLEWIDRSQYNRRKKDMQTVLNQIRQRVAATLPNVINLHIIDCIGTEAITVTKFFQTESFPNAGIGFCASKDKRYAGYKTATIVSLDGLIEDFVTDSATPHDSVYGESLLTQQGVGDYMGDKGFIFKPEVKQALEDKGVHIITPYRSNMKQQNTKHENKLLKRFRRTVETVNGQLTEHFHFDRPGGKSELGVLARLMVKITAHTFGLAILRKYNLSPMKLDLLVGA